MADTSFEFIVGWFKDAAKMAKKQGKTDSALLWKDGFQHLTEIHNDLVNTQLLLSMAIDEIDDCAQPQDFDFYEPAKKILSR